MRTHIARLTLLHSILCLLILPTAGNTAENTVKLVKNIKPAVVLIQTFDANNSPLGTGSGFFIDNKGSVITNHHVIEGAYSATVKTSAGKEYKVTGIIAKDTEVDIVKLAVNIADANIAFLKLSKQVPSEGEDIVVVGNPLGFEFSASTGIVSAVRNIPAFGNIIQITAPISPGSSGSPIVNSKGEVIGIATLIATKGQNLNFAIPSGKIIALKETSKVTLSESYASLTADPNDAQGLFHKGLAAAFQGNSSAAITYFQKAKKVCPQNDWVLWFYLGLYFDKLGCYEDAIEADKQAIKINHDLDMAHNNLGVVYCKLGRYEEAIEAYKQAIRIRPDYADAHDNLAVVYYNLGNSYGESGLNEDAIKATKQAIRIKPDFAEAHCNLGTAYCELGRVQEAIEAYKQAIRIKPDFVAEVHNMLGNAYSRFGRYQEAIAAYKQAIKIKPDYADAHYNLGLKYAKLGRYKEAIDAYKQTIKVRPNDTEAHYNLGSTYAKLGRYQEAIDAYKQTIKVRPDVADAHRDLGRVYLSIGDKNSALEEYKILKTLDANIANELFDMIYK